MQFLPNLKLWTVLHQRSPLGWLRLSRSYSMVWGSSSPVLASPFTFTHVRLALESVDFLWPLLVPLLFTLHMCYLHYSSCISNSTLVFVSRITQTGENQCVCTEHSIARHGIYLRRKPSPEDLQSDFSHMLLQEMDYYYPACSAFLIPCPIKACSEMNFELSKIDIFLLYINKLFLLEPSLVWHKVY